MKITQKMFLFYTHLQIYTKIEPEKCIYKNVPCQISDIFMFICITFLFFNLFISSENVSICCLSPFTKHDKYMVQNKSFSSFLPLLTSANIWLFLFSITLQSKKDSSIGTWPIKQLSLYVPTAWSWNIFASSCLSWLHISFSSLYGFHVSLYTWWPIITLSTDSA